MRASLLQSRVNYCGPPQSCPRSRSEPLPRPCGISFSDLHPVPLRLPIAQGHTATWNSVPHSDPNNQSPHPRPRAMAIARMTMSSMMMMPMRKRIRMYRGTRWKPTTSTRWSVAPLSSESAVVCSLRTLYQKCIARALALLEVDELIYLLWTVDAFAESNPQHLQVLRLEWCHWNLSWLSAVSYLRECTVPLSPELPPWRRNVIASDG